MDIVHVHSCRVCFRPNVQVIVLSRDSACCHVISLPTTAITIRPSIMNISSQYVSSIAAVPYVELRVACITVY